MDNGPYNKTRERRKELSRINIPLDDSIDRRELFGGMDQNLRNIEGMFGVTIIQRSDGLLIIEDGDRAVRSDNGVEHAAAILRRTLWITGTRSKR